MRAEAGSPISTYFRVCDGVRVRFADTRAEAGRRQVSDTDDGNVLDDAVDHDRVKGHLDAGADHVCIQVFDVEPHGMPPRRWRTLAMTMP